MSLLPRCTCPDNGVFGYSKTCSRHAGVQHVLTSAPSSLPPVAGEPVAVPLPAILAKDYEGGTCVSDPDNSAKVTLYYRSAETAEAVFEAIAGMIDAALAAAPLTASKGEGVRSDDGALGEVEAFVHDLLWDGYLTCCGCPVEDTGGEYMGQQEVIMSCCGNQEPKLLNDKEIVAALRVRFPEFK